MDAAVLTLTRLSSPASMRPLLFEELWDCGNVCYLGKIVGILKTLRKTQGRLDVFASALGGLGIPASIAIEKSWTLDGRNGRFNRIQHQKIVTSHAHEIVYIDVW